LKPAIARATGGALATDETHELSVATVSQLVFAQGSSASVKRSVLPFSTRASSPSAAIALSGYASLEM
jgi:hypothetical protein